MGFLSPDESIVLMNLCPSMGEGSRHLDDRELDLLYQVGCRTLLEYVSWDIIESDMGSRVYDHLDQYIKRARGHGYKVMLSTPLNVPKCFSKEWYPWGREGNPIMQPSTFSFFNEEAMQYQLQFIRMIKARYEAQDILLYISQMGAGESVYHNGWAYGDPGCVQLWQGDGHQDPMEFDNPVFCNWLERHYIERLIQMQHQILDAGGDDQEGPVHDEIWTAIHPLLSARVRGDVGLLGNGCDFYENILASYRNAFPTTSITWLQYTYWPHGSGYQDLVQRVKGSVPIQDLVGGAEWVQGLSYSAPGLLQRGLRALLLGAIHPYSGHIEVTPEMATQVKWAIDLIKEHRGV